MTKKQITIKSLSKLTANKNSNTVEDLVDKWVNKELDPLTTNKPSDPSNSLDLVEETRFTISIPKYLHRRIKKYCASSSISMKKKLIEVLEANFPEI